MLNEEDYSSDSSDEDYIPQGAESDNEEEPISDNEIDDDDDENIENANKKLKRGRGKIKKKNPLLTAVDSHKELKNEHADESVNKEQNTKKEEGLWADFLADVDEKPAPPLKQKSTKSWAHLLDNKKNHPQSVSATNSTLSSKLSLGNKNTLSDVLKPDKVKVTKIFQFAGEEVKVEEEVPADSADAIKDAALYESKSATKGLTASKRPLGLSKLVSLIDSKKQKLTTLEKTKLDWNCFKSSEGIAEELETHKKSKAGYLEKQEFLERADLRQFEIEKAMRASRRSSR